jgi:hypothetical protein
MPLSAEEKKVRADKRKQDKYNKEHKIINETLYKWCTEDEHWVICDEKHFYINKSNTVDNFSNRCIECEKKRAMQWKINNRPRVRKSARKYNAKPHIKLKMREASKKQREEGYQVKYQQENKEQINQYSKNRQQKNHRITKEEWENCKHYFANRCAYCGLGIENHLVMKKGKMEYHDLHKEHAIHDGKDNLSNCIPSCRSCNDKKWKFTLNQWYNLSNPIYTYERYHKIYQWLRYDYKKYIHKKKQKGKYVKKNMEYWDNKK